MDLIAVEEGRVVIGGVEHTAAASTEAGSGDRGLRRGRRPWTRWADRTLWRTAAAAAQPTARVDPTAIDEVLPVRVDPIIALHDVLASPGPDAAEAGEHLRRAILDGAWRG
ncbi:hypothetical protein SIM91_44565 [Rhodococcus opacus]|uniref:hypothetical protein n=1 Tax=Rhodococcus opacus TaxID=37919 RepID=UPI001FFB5C51|nr:hypothetical protein [Rhodococcus opacus]MDX5970211.1 hypothetical protein [Rhodococcus opacus]